MSSLYLRNAVGRVDFEKTEQWDALLELTHAVWRVADITLDNEMLKDRLKQGAMNILSDYPGAVSGRRNVSDVIDQIRSQCALLSLAQKTTHGSRQMNFVILKNEYYKISAMLAQYGEEMARTTSATKQHSETRHENSYEEPKRYQQSAVTEQAEKHAPLSARQEASVAATPVAPAVKKQPVTNTLNDRQKKILQFFNKRKGENIRLKEIAQFFPDLTDRTVRNDLRDLCLKKMVSRSEGHGQASFYRLAKNGIADDAAEDSE